MVDWISLAVPVAYLGVLVGSLATFSFLYKARQAGSYSCHYPIRTAFPLHLFPPLRRSPSPPFSAPH
jgi:translocation protein SEC66